MKVKVIGKRHLEGKSRKTGKEYSNTVVFCTYKQNGVEGETCDSLWLDSGTYPLASIHIGNAYDVDRDSRGYIVAFEPIATR